MSSEEPKSRKPANTAFKQQRLKAWQPILTPKTVLPTLFLIGIIFAPIGGVLLFFSNQVKEIVIDYTDCKATSNSFVNIPTSDYEINLPSGAKPQGGTQGPKYKSESVVDKDFNITTQKCTIQFPVVVDIEGPVYFYYRLTNFYQNHRRYVKSVSYKQLQGAQLSAKDLEQDCKPLAERNGKPIYPCGLIANSLFNDTYSSLQSIDNNNKEYAFSSDNISWPADDDVFKETAYKPSDVLPPPNWVARYPNGEYTDEFPPKSAITEHLKVWMRIAGLPHFRKLYGKSDQTLKAGMYQMTINMNYDDSIFGGRKAIVISTGSFLGGRNPFLGSAYIAIGALCVLFGIVFTAMHMYRPRKLGDPSYLSWNQAQSGSDGQRN